MELDPLTTVLEIVNFLVLIWLLKRFLFKPVQAAIVRRQQTLEQAQLDARQQTQQAEALQRQLQGKIDDWEQEKARQQQELQNQLSQQRERALAKVREEADAEKKRLQLILEQDRAALEDKTRHQAQQGALKLTGQLLQRLAGAELDQALLVMLLEDLQQLPAEEHSRLLNAAQQQKSVVVTSARPLTNAQQQQLQQVLSQVLGQAPGESIELTTKVDEQLVSGIRLAIGPLLLHANLADELAFFKAELQHAI